MAAIPPTSAEYDSPKDEEAYPLGYVKPSDQKQANVLVVDEDVFVHKEGGPNYRSLGFFGTVVLLTKQQIGLGVLSLPQAFTTLGLVPGLLIIIFFGAVTTYANYMLGEFRRIHPSAHSMGDVGFIIWGVGGREFLGWGFWLFECFLAASGILGMSIALNTISNHGTCTVVFALVAAIIIGLGASVRTFRQISFMGWVGISFIIPAILIVLIKVAVSDRPPAAPPGPFDRELRAFGNPSFVEAMSSTVGILFAWCGTPGFLPIISEMRSPGQYTRAMLVAQTFCAVFYLVVAVVMWRFAGVYVTSPALGSAGPLFKKIAYGVAIPGLLAGPIIYAHLSAKYCFVRVLRGTRHLQESTYTHWITWLSLVVGVTGFAFIIAQVIPFFSDLIGLVGAIFGSLFCIVIIGPMWIYDNHYKLKTSRNTLSFKLLYLNAVLFAVVGLGCLGAGLYASVESIQASFNAGSVGHPFSCADNS